MSVLLQDENQDHENDQAREDGETASEDGEEAEGSGTKTSKKKTAIQKNLKIILIISGVFAVSGALFFFLNGSKDVSEKDKKELQKKMIDETVYFELPDILVNLHDPSGRYGGLLKLSLYLELANQQDVDHVEKLKPKIVDQFQLYLRGLKTKDISGSTGLQRLREELLNLTNGVTEPVTVRSVLFREMLVQ